MHEKEVRVQNSMNATSVSVFPSRIHGGILCGMVSRLHDGTARYRAYDGTV
jgi:hypothetical protein